jgi:hypothetical protein
MNTAEVIRQLEESPREIEVRCPSDHFIRKITLSVRDGQLAMGWGLSGKDMRRRASQKGEFSLPMFTYRTTGTLCRLPVR